MARPTLPDPDSRLLAPITRAASPESLQALRTLAASLGLPVSGDDPGLDESEEALNRAASDVRERIGKALVEGQIQPDPALLSALLGHHEEALFIGALMVSKLPAETPGPDGVPLLQKAVAKGLYAPTWHCLCNTGQAPSAQVLAQALDAAVARGRAGPARLLLGAGAKPRQRHLHQALKHESHATFSNLLEAGGCWPKAGSTAERRLVAGIMAHESPHMLSATLAYGPALSHWTTLVEGATSTLFYEAMYTESCTDKKALLVLERVLTDGIQNPNAAQTTLGATLLHTCLGPRRVPDPLLDRVLALRGLNVSARDGAGKTPMAQAMQYRQDQTVLRKLLVAGADIKECFTPARQHSLFPVQYLSRSQDSTTKWLLELGLAKGAIDADVLNRDNGYCTLLQWCIGRGYPIARDLLKVPGIDPNAGPAVGEDPPLTLAAWHNQRELIKPLIEAGANPNGGDWGAKLSPLALVVKRGWLDECSALLEAGARVDESTLTCALMQPRTDKEVLMQRLLATQPPISETLLCRAARDLCEENQPGQERCFTLLLEACDDPSARRALLARTLRNPALDPATSLTLPFAQADVTLFQTMGAADAAGVEPDAGGGPLGPGDVKRLVGLGVDPSKLLGYVEGLYSHSSPTRLVSHADRTALLEDLLAHHQAVPPDGMLQALAKAGAPAGDLTLLAAAAPWQLKAPDEDGNLPLTNLLANTARVSTTQVQALVVAGSPTPPGTAELAGAHSQKLVDYLIAHVKKAGLGGREAQAGPDPV